MDGTKLLASLREKRGFDVNAYVDKKIKAINNFFRTNKLDAVVLGISGGIDSAVVFYLYAKAMREKDSPLKQVLPISMPIHDSPGVTGQMEAVNKAKLVIESLDFSHYEVDLTEASESIVRSSCDIFENAAWAIGQMNSVLRTPVLYFHAAILQTAGFKSIVSGTTNRDEGAYIGFFGKASDAMVDIQPIADIHKSEVYQVAKYLGVPEEIINATPKGDVWDGKTDQEMIGAPYWAVEQTILMLQYGIKDLEIDEVEMQEFIKYYSNINDIHNKNAHKYEVGNPAHFIDVMERKVICGWQ